MTTQHTPGPWWLEEENGLIVDANGDAICATGSLTNEQGNAPLITAAPDMLEALQAIENWLSVSFVTTPQDMAQSFEEMYWTARRVIAKAKGQTE